MVSSRSVGIVVLGALTGAVIIYAVTKYAGKGSKSNFTRTCLTADTNCQFVRTPVDYIYKNSTEIPPKIGRDYPHLMGDPRDKLQPLEQGRINLVRDEMKLWNPDLLWKQYEHDWAGCGNSEPYIVNDEKTRFSLAETGRIDVWRKLYAEKGPLHGSQNVRYPALSEADVTSPEPYDASYGGLGYLGDRIGD